MKTKKSYWFYYMLSVGVLALLMALGFRSQSTHAIECNGTLTSQDCQHTEVGSPLSGNYRTAVAAIGMYPNEATETITLAIPNCTAGSPTIVRATAYWAMRDFDDLNYWDESVDIARDAGSPVTVNSNRRYKANMGGGGGSSYVADITSDGIVSAGTHTYTITNFTTSPGATNPSTSQWGFGIHAVYECPEYSQVTIQQTEGHDIHWFGWSNGWDTDRSDLICEVFTPSISARTISLEFFMPGSADTAVRQADLWYKTGTGSAPSPTAYDLLTDVNTPANGGIVLERLVFEGEPELEVYTNTVTLPASHEYLCIQTDSSFDATEHPDDSSAWGASMFAGLGFFSYAPATTANLSLGNLVWEDVNNNGLFDGSESGICGVDVHLYSDSNSDNKYDSSVEGTSPLQTTTTACGGSAGQYTFSSLTAGDYLVVIPSSEFASGQPLNSYVSSTGSNGVSTGPYEQAPDPDNNTNNDDNGFLQSGSGGAVSCAVTLADGTEPTNDGDADNDTNLSVDFGFFNDAQLGDYVWYDLNRNGKQDSGETGVSGVTATIYDATSDTALSSQTTSASGAYLFSYLTPGSYYVIFTNLPAGYGLVSNDSSDDATDSDADPATARTPTYVLAAGEVNSTVDGGLYANTELASTGLGVLPSILVGVAILTVSGIIGIAPIKSGAIYR